MRRCLRLLQSFGRQHGGATAVEYGLLVALLSMVVIAAVTSAGVNLYGVMNTLSARIAGR